MADGERAPAGIGCLGLVIGAVVVAAVVVLIFFVGFIVLGVVAALAIIGLLVMAVDRVLLALSPKRRERRANQRQTFVWRFGQFPPNFPSGDIIDTTAIEEDPDAGSDHRPGELGPQ